MACVYPTCAVFVIFVLGPICRYSGFSLWKFLKFIKEELFTVLGTSSSESVLPQMIAKMEKAGVSKPVAGMIIPSGLTFNPDGQAIYYTIAAIFDCPGDQHATDPDRSVDRAGGVDVHLQGLGGRHRLRLHHSGGNAFVPGHHSCGGMVLLLGVDRFMSEARAITNTIGNGVGTMAIAKWVGALDTVKCMRPSMATPKTKCPRPCRQRSAAAAPSLAINPLRGNLQKTTRA